MKKNPKENANPYRLDRNISPAHYSIELEPNLENFTFRGREKIAIKARHAFSKITLHCAEIKVVRATLSGDDAIHPFIGAQEITYDEKMETVTFDFVRTLQPHEATCLDIDFSGELNDKMHGFYRTSYEVNGEKRWGAATQFEATDARRCFPCWDEPDFKATFGVTLKVPNQLTALSNMPVIDEKALGGDKKMVVYDDTPIMSTYLLCFVIADLEYIEARDKNGVLIRVYTTPGKKNQGKFALEVALHTLPYFAEWFDIPYALPKCDQVALPDFASGAMENWGLVTYRETALLVDPDNSSAAAKQRVAEVVDHELAHQWFGNLVTMEWWTDLWLNEGFASYMGPKAVNNQFPEWDVWEQFVVGEYLTALHSDGLKNTHPIEIPVKNPAEIREIFDHITYSKGSVVNRMLEHYLGEEKFRKGLRVYLKKYAYQNAKTKDLWHVLEEISGKPVKAIMAGYTQQGGYPVLKVETHETKTKRVLKLEQKRFLFDGSKDPSNPAWHIPLVITASGLKNPVVTLMDKRETEISLPAAESKWVKINFGQSGFYRTAYPESLLDPLTKAMASNKLSKSVMDYLGVLDDAMALARAGEIKTSKALDVVTSCKNQTDYNVWVTIASGVGSVDHILVEKEPCKRLHQFAQELFRPIVLKKGWDQQKKDSHTDLLLRSLVIHNLGRYGDEKVLAEARKRFQAFVKTGELAPNLRSAVYSLIAQYGDSADFDKLVEIYKKSPLQEEKVRVLRALTRFRKKEVIKKVLDFSLSNSVRNQDAYVILSTFGGNPEGRKPAWNFIKTHFEKLKERYSGSVATMLGRILEGSTSGFLTREDFEDAKEFFKNNPIPGTERAMKQSLEVIQSSIAWSKRDQSDIANWLRSKQ
jgi:puromycin-sensitive aminopeptidase